MLIINQKILDKNNFVNTVTEKTAIVGHHTAGGSNPINVIDGWNSDSRGRVAAHYVIGGVGIQGSLIYDGEIFQAVREENNCFHLGVKGNNQAFDLCSIGIELCNYGFLNKSNNGKYYTYVNSIVPDNQVIDLGYEFRGYRYWHKYTDKQIRSLYLLIKDIQERRGILINKSDINFLFQKSLLKQHKIKGFYMHTNFIESGKWDLSPQPNLIKMLQSL
jgi:N-acetyl-anhydromuramyl-L-alanine amidase AmpD